MHDRTWTRTLIQQSMSVLVDLCRQAAQENKAFEQGGHGAKERDPRQKDWVQ